MAGFHKICADFRKDVRTRSSSGRLTMEQEEAALAFIKAMEVAVNTANKAGVKEARLKFDAAIPDGPIHTQGYKVWAAYAKEFPKAIKSKQSRSQYEEASTRKPSGREWKIQNPFASRKAAGGAPRKRTAQEQPCRQQAGGGRYPSHPDDYMYAEFGGRNAYEALVEEEEMRVEAAWKARTDYAKSFFRELEQFEKRWKMDCSGNLDSAAETGYFQSAVGHMRGVCVDLMRKKEDVYLGDPDLLYYYSHNRLGGAQRNFLFYEELLEAWGRFVKNVPPEP